MTKKKFSGERFSIRPQRIKKTKFTQKELATQFGFSLSTVFNALKIPREAGAIKASGRDFVVIDTEKFLNIWTTFHRIKYENLIVLKADSWLAKLGKITPDVQTYVDLWNLSEWYAKDFLKALKEKMK